MIENIKIAVDNSGRVVELLGEALERALEEIGLQAERGVKERLTSQGQVDTGFLRNSITYAISGEGAATSSYKADKGKGNKPPKSNTYQGTAPKDKDKSVYVGTNVEYAMYVEDRKSYLRDGVTAQNEVFKNIIEYELKNA